MSATRVPTLTEMSYISALGGQAPTIRTNLGCASTADITSSLAPISSQIADISAVNIIQSQQIADISGAGGGVSEATVAAISAALFTDINNLDLSLTNKISSECLTSDGISGSASTVIAYINVSISGTIYKLGIVS